MARNLTIIFFLIVLNGLVFLGCDGPMGELDRRIALKTGLNEARQAQAFEVLRPGESPDRTRLRSLLEAVLSSSIRNGQKTLYRIETSVVIAPDDPEGFRMTDRVEVAMESPNRWHVVHNSEWMSDGLNRETGRRCRLIDERFFIGTAHGPMTELVPQAREDQSCLRRSLGAFNELLSQIADHISSRVHSMNASGKSPLLRITFEGQQAGEPLPIPVTWPTELPNSERKEVRPRGHLFAERGRLDRITGSLVVNGRTQQLVSAEVRTEIQVRKSDRDTQLTVAVKVDSSPFTADIAIPEKIEKATARPRIFKDMKSLLGLDFKDGKRGPFQSQEMHLSSGSMPMDV